MDDETRDELVSQTWQYLDSHCSGQAWRALVADCFDDLAEATEHDPDWGQCDDDGERWSAEWANGGPVYHHEQWQAWHDLDLWAMDRVGDWFADVGMPGDVREFAGIGVVVARDHVAQAVLTVWADHVGGEA
jgi:hypothetical protein